MTWRIWVALGIALLAAAVATPGVFAFCFGIAALLVGILAAQGPPAVPAQR